MCLGTPGTNQGTLKSMNESESIPGQVICGEDAFVAGLIHTLVFADEETTQICKGKVFTNQKFYKFNIKGYEAVKGLIDAGIGVDLFGLRPDPNLPEIKPAGWKRVPV